MEYSHLLISQKEKCKSLLDRLLEDYDYVSILGKDTTMQSTSVDANNSNLSNMKLAGYVIKLYINKHYQEYSLNDLNLPVDELAAKIKSATSLHPDIEAQARQIDLLEEEDIKQVFSRPNEGKEYTMDELSQEATKLKDLILSRDKRIINASVSIRTRYESSMFLSPHKDLEQFYTWTNLSMMAIIKEGSNLKRAMIPIAYNNIEKCINEAYERIDELCDLASELLQAVPIEPGYYDVIVDPSISGLIAHEAFGHGVELDMFVKNRAKAKDYVNEYVASPIVNMRDGASSILSAASYFFDDDGVLAHDTTIIENGILKHGISDALSALELHQEPTGNGRRESYLRKSYSRMTNTFFMPGNDSLEDMIASIDYGYMISQTSNGMEDPKNWQIQCVAQYGREIRNGKFTGKIVSPVVMSGYVPDLLKSISMISDPSTFVVTGSGMCGKGHKEWVFVSDGGAYMKAKVKLG